MRQPICARAHGRAGGDDRRILAKAGSARLARHRLSGSIRRQRAWAGRSRRLDGGDGAAGHARPIPVYGAARRRGDRRSRYAGAAPRMAAADRRRREKGGFGLDRASAALGRRRHSTGGARDAGRLYPLRQQAFCRRRASRRHPGGRRAHPRRQHDGGRGQLVPRPPGHLRRDRRHDADNRRDPQIVRGPARQCRAAGRGLARRRTSRLGAAVAGRGAGDRGALLPRCAAERSRCST